MRASVFIATSLDGFIARRDGRLDWLPSGEGPGGEDYGYARFMSSVDALVMGRKTFRTALSFGAWPYGKKPVIVLSRRRLRIPKSLPRRVEAMSGTPAAVAKRLEKRGLRRLYVDGGRTIRGFLDAGLVDRLIITRVPVLLGSGIPLFGPLRRDVRLRHLRTKSYPTGLVQSAYEVVKARPTSARTARHRAGAPSP